MSDYSIEVVFSFDTTGSMYPCLTQVRRKVKETVTRLMKDIPGLDERLAGAREAGVFGTKERSVIHSADPYGIAQVVEQQFELVAGVGQPALAGVAQVGLEPAIDRPIEVAGAGEFRTEERQCTVVDAGARARTRCHVLPSGDASQWCQASGRTGSAESHKSLASAVDMLTQITSLCVKRREGGFR